MNSHLLDRERQGTNTELRPSLREDTLSAPAYASSTLFAGELFTIRTCRGTDELDQCVALQQQTWGYPDREVVPRNIYVLAQTLGGHVLAAWDRQGELAGFAMAMAAHEPDAGMTGESRMHSPAAEASEQQELPADQRSGSARQSAPKPYLHSHMVAVCPRYQDQGLGLALKLAQREDALSRGITTMRWTFDPLVAKNAYFNLRRLGATVSRYLPDFYGPLASALQGGLPTDRLLAEWDLTRELAPEPERGQAKEKVEAQPHAARLDSSQVDGQITLSSEIARWRAAGAASELAAAQGTLRAQFQSAFRRGLILRDFAPETDGGGVYRLQGAC